MQQHEMLHISIYGVVYNKSMTDMREFIFENILNESIMDLPEKFKVIVVIEKLPKS